MVTHKNIEFTLEGGLARVVLNRPPLNVINIEAMGEINGCLRTLEGRTDVKAVVFSSTQKVFSAGVDIGEHMGNTATKMLTDFHDIFRNLIALGIPTVALVRGGAFGGGCELACFCDTVFASDKASFGQPEIKVGVFPPVAAALFGSLVGNKKAYELVMTGEIIDANQAQQIGLINTVVPDAAFESESAAYLKRFTDLSAVVLKHTRRAVAGPSDAAFLERLKELEKYYLKQLMKSEDAHEGLTSFLEKRPPIWKNK